MLRRAVWGTVFGGSALAAAAGATAYYYRPLPDFSVDGVGPDRKKEGGPWTSEWNMPDDVTKRDSLLMAVARKMVIALTVAVGRFMHQTLNVYEMKEDERYHHFLEVLAHREEGRALITVANHTSVMDDPVLVSNLLPMTWAYNPHYQRWAFCTQEICFSTTALAAFFGAGKTLPAHRGAGINQKLLLDYMRHVSNGEWCHIFPEAGTYQKGTLGGRLFLKPLHARTQGRLKWGVGKMIAHARKPAIVIPWYHTGMESVLPQHPVTNHVLFDQLSFGHLITVRFGDEIHFDDLIEEHEKTHGPLLKYAPRKADDPSQHLHDFFDSTQAERLLYHKITNRIEAKLVELEGEANADLLFREEHGKLPPGRVHVKQSPLAHLMHISNEELTSLPPPPDSGCGV